MAVELLPDELWNEVKPLLPTHRVSSKGGRPPVDDRLCLRALIFILRSGMAYNLLPSEVFGVSGVTAWRRLRDWTRVGIWQQLHQLLLNRLGRLGEIDLRRAVVDSESVRAVFGGHTPDRVP
jgi:transposase